MTLFVDADSCPVRIREIICKTAKRLQVPAVFAANRQIPIPKNAYDDLYEVCLFKPNHVVYYDQEDDIIYIVANNGNDSVQYDVCWQIVKGVYKTRIIGESL
mgnify:CR=1 FL=1